VELRVEFERAEATDDDRPAYRGRGIIEAMGCVRARKNFPCNARRSTQIRDTNSELRRVVMPPCGVKRRYEESTVKRVALRADMARERGSLLRLPATLWRKPQTRKIYCATRGVARGYGA